MASCSTFSALLLSVVLIFNLGIQSCYCLGTFGFDIHHRYSDTVRGILSVDGLPEKGSFEYYAALAHRDLKIHGRGLLSENEKLLTFANGNTTFRISSFGFLHYANISLGTPSLSFLVALDTGSDLFWVPCDCISCLTVISNSTNESYFNFYSPKASLTSKKVPCNSSFCELQRGCSGTPTKCPYQVRYLSEGTSTAGILIEDVLHLKTEDDHRQVVDAPITFGCGQVQTGDFLEGAAPNGLFGLGMNKLSVPSILSSAGLVANSFSMCFGSDGIGRINFGDKGSADQEETPFNLHKIYPTYNISVTQISVESDLMDIDFSAIFDSGTSFTYLNDPAYTRISESFNSKAKDKRHPSDTRIPFEYCYDLSLNATNITIPTLNLTMKGGGRFTLFDPIVFISSPKEFMYCLGVVKSSDVNIIGQNFMTGYRIVFDREKKILGWKNSNCYDSEDSEIYQISPKIAPAMPPSSSVQPSTYNPEATKDTGKNSQKSGAPAPPPLVGQSVRLIPLNYILLMLVLSTILIL